MLPTTDRYWTSASNTYKYTLNPLYATSTTSDCTSWVPYTNTLYYSPFENPEYKEIWYHYNKKKEKDEFEICKD